VPACPLAAGALVSSSQAASDSTAADDTATSAERLDARRPRPHPRRLQELERILATDEHSSVESAGRVRLGTMRSSVLLVGLQGFLIAASGCAGDEKSPPPPSGSGGGHASGGSSAGGEAGRAGSAAAGEAGSGTAGAGGEDAGLDVCIPCAGGSGGAGGSGAEGGAGGAAHGPTDIGGIVIELADDDFDGGSKFSGSAEIKSEMGVSGPVQTTYSGSSWSLKDVQASPELWLWTNPTSDVVDVMPTFARVDASSGTDFDLPLVRRAVLDAIYDAIAPSGDPIQHGHLILRFVDGSGAAASGVSLTFHVGETVAYDSGATFSTSAAATGARGIAIVVNATGFIYPGLPQPVDWMRGSDSGSVDVPIAWDTASLTEIVVP
jgi:hypothetical protein